MGSKKKGAIAEPPIETTEEREPELHIPPAPLTESAALADGEAEELAEFLQFVDLDLVCSPVLIQARDMIPRRAWANGDGTYSVQVRLPLYDGRPGLIMTADAETMRVMRARFDAVRARLLNKEGWDSYADRPELRFLYDERFFNRGWQNCDQRIKNAKAAQAAIESPTKAKKSSKKTESAEANESARQTVNESLKTDDIIDDYDFPF